MAVQLDTSGKDDLKTQFVTREGEYRLMTLSEYSRPNRVGYQNNQSSPQVRVSIVSLPSPPPQPPISGGVGGGGQLSGTAGSTSASNSNSNNITLTKQQSFSNGLEHQTASGYSTPVGGDRICFNYGKELYVYSYRGAKKATDLNKPIDKKLYKGTSPSCHDFNGTAATCEGAPLLVGFSTGQIQLVHPGRREQGKLFNEERNIDKTKVTCLKWIPGSQNQFLVSHASGCIYLYNDELPCTPATPSYQTCKGGDGYVVLASKSKATKNPLYKWCFGQHENASINEFCFSPCGQHLAVVSQDGFLRIFHYEHMELVGIARSYFGGFLCVCWSPDGKYVVVGGEDDLVTVFSLHEQRVVARGQGHRSWVSVVAFDPYTTSYSTLDGDDLSDEETSLSEQHRNHHHHGSGYSHPDGSSASAKQPQQPHDSSACDKLTAQNRLATCYRLGSVSQDTQICLWDITEDVLRQSFGRVVKSTNHAGKKEVMINGLSNGECEIGAKGDKFSLAKGSKPSDDVVDNASFKQHITPATLGAIGSNSLYSSSNIKPTSSSSTYANMNCDDKANSDSSSDKESVDSKIGKRANSSGTAEVEATGANSSSSNTVPSKGSTTGGKKSKGDSGQQQQQHSSSTFNSITQRLTSLSFGSGGSGASSTSSGSGSSCDKNDKPSGKATGAGGTGGGSSKRSIITIGSKGFSSNSNSNSLNNNHHVLNSISNSNQTGSGSPSGGGMTSTLTSIMTSSLTKGKGSGGGGAGGSGGAIGSGGFAPCGRIVSSYDPMKLIGTPACPRYDDCPVLEPLICKKIAHERLTALIFREDCFLTACQDGYVYTWARPGFVNIPQHLSSTPSAPPGGTVV
ncbi:WD repeat-containing protein 20 [Anopheles ziemanni]|uniref:WD repeat-containing protein 20 n=1 Tax=Anopheles coustani TaxID=139045 RepID=UPI00265A2D8B|nr:WD repeat-containing protein 20 [Anopheles coustani]XP_058174581.1 WD repeat-containing protein 20 [Anopheles ziemanni]